MTSAMKKNKTETMPQKANGKLLESIVIILFSIIMLILLIKFVPASPNSSDIQLYHQIGLKNQKIPFVLNRYFHIYLQKIFTTVAPTALEGLAWFWAFLSIGTMLLVYFVSKKVSITNGIVTGIISLLFFVAIYFSPEMELVGISYVDVTAMFLVMVIISVYLMSLEKKLWLIVLGTVIFLGFKTKETTLPVSAIIVLFGWHSENLNLKYWWSKVKYVILGLGIGVLIMAILNQIFISDFLFGLRPSDIREYINTYIPESGFFYANNVFENWYYSFWFKFSLVAFVLYILSGVNNKSLSLEQRILWLTPLAITLFIIFTINNRWGFLSRFILPAIPIMCALSPQFLSSNQPVKLGKKTITPFRILLIVFGLTVLILGIIFLWSHISGVNIGASYNLFVIPVLLTIILAYLFALKRIPIFDMLLWALVLVTIAYPIYKNVKEIVHTPQVHQEWQQTIDPIMTFSNSIEVDESMLFCIDPQVFSEAPLTIVKNRDELFGIFDIAMNSSTSRENFSVSTSEFLSCITKPENACTYILTHSETVFDPAFEKQFNEMVNNYYSSEYSPNRKLIFYILNKP
jgi:hypothetical protein